MKRLIVINILLIVALSVMPSEKLPLKETQIATEVGTEIVEEQKVTSRSLEEPRTESEQNSTESIQIATEISDNCINLVKKYEGCKLKAYRLEGETNYTIGYGHSGADVKQGQQITQATAESLLKADLEGYKQYVLKQNLELNQNELDALVSFTYNCGIGNLKKLVKGRNKQEIAEHITGYTKSSSEANRNGLAKRRTEEQKLFLGGEN